MDSLVSEYASQSFLLEPDEEDCMTDDEKIRFEREQVTGSLRVIEVDREFRSKLMELMQPDERWTRELPDGRSAVMLWTMAAGNRALLFTVTK